MACCAWGALHDCRDCIASEREGFRGGPAPLLSRLCCFWLEVDWVAWVSRVLRTRTRILTCAPLFLLAWVLRAFRHAPPALQPPLRCLGRTHVGCMGLGASVVSGFCQVSSILFCSSLGGCLCSDELVRRRCRRRCCCRVGRMWLILFDLAGSGLVLETGCSGCGDRRPGGRRVRGDGCGPGCGRRGCDAPRRGWSAAVGRRVGLLVCGIP